MLRHGSKQSHYLWSGFGKHIKNDAIFNNGQTDSYIKPGAGLSYFLTRRDLPVISTGCSRPIISIRVGAMSAKQPPSLNVYASS